MRDRTGSSSLDTRSNVRVAGGIPAGRRIPLSANTAPAAGLGRTGGSPGRGVRPGPHPGTYPNRCVAAHTAVPGLRLSRRFANPVVHVHGKKPGTSTRYCRAGAENELPEPGFGQPWRIFHTVSGCAQGKLGKNRGKPGFGTEITTKEPTYTGGRSTSVSSSRTLIAHHQSLPGPCRVAASGKELQFFLWYASSTSAGIRPRSETL